MAIALTATGWWIYIDQAITPNAGGLLVSHAQLGRSDALQSLFVLSFITLLSV